MSFGAGPAHHTSGSREIPERMEDRLIVALDVPSIAEARRLVDTLDGVVSFFKIGYWLLFAAGVDGFIAELGDRGKKVFVDAKLFDIGETVKRGVARVAERGASFVTVHGDGDIIRAAAEGKQGSDLQVLVVPVLTSLDDQGLRELGYAGTVRELLTARARLAVACGCDGIIAAPRDDPNEIRRAVGSERLLVVTPAVRLPGASLDDHKRAGTPAEAIAAGADYIIVGRPIIRSDDPARAAAAIIDCMRAAA
jgi:orotidine-5'-phosphate decarboxylase